MSIVKLGTPSEPHGFPWSVARPIKPTFSHTPIVMVDTSTITEEEWKTVWRPRGIGGSDGAGVLGESPFWTNVDVLAGKRDGVEKKFDEKGRFRLDCGHAMEPMVARACQLKHPEWKVFKDTNMYRHPEAPFMLADMDYLAVNEDGELVIVECKYVSHESRYEWLKDSKYYYEIQIRHYMAVTGINKAVLCVLWGNDSDSDYTEYAFVRDKEWEIDYINQLADFWYDNVVDGAPLTLRSHYGKATVEALKRLLDEEEASGSKSIGGEYAADAEKLRDCEERLAQLKSRIDQLNGEAEQYRARLILALDGAEEGSLELDDGTTVYVSNKRGKTNKIDVDKLKAEYPAAFEKCMEDAAKKITLDSLRRASAIAARSCITSVPNEHRKFGVRFKERY